MCFVSAISAVCPCSDVTKHHLTIFFAFLSSILASSRACVSCFAQILKRSETTCCATSSRSTSAGSIVIAASQTSYKLRFQNVKNQNLGLICPKQLGRKP